MVWLFAGLRSDEIARLRVGAIRWKHAEDGSSAHVCLLDVPVNKTSTAFVKPVDPIVGEGIEGWEKVRPRQPASRTERPEIWCTLYSPTEHVHSETGI